MEVKGNNTGKKIAIAIGGAILAIIAWTANDSVIHLQNIQALPGELSKTKDQFLSWYHNDQSWTGLWSNFPEGILDMKRLNLSDTEIKIIIHSKQGVIEGVISSKESCAKFPLLRYVLLEGRVDFLRPKATIIAHDVIRGDNIFFGRMLASIDKDQVMTIEFQDDPSLLFPKTIRLAKTPNLSADDAYKQLDDCAEERRSALSAGWKDYKNKILPNK